MKIIQPLRDLEGINLSPQVAVITNLSGNNGTKLAISFVDPAGVTIPPLSLILVDTFGNLITPLDGPSLSGPTGSGLVGFLSPLPGGLTRTVQAKLQDTVSLLDFAGADPTGTSSSNAAFTSAIASGREIYIPAGTYLISALIFSGLRSCRIRGAGREVTNLVVTASGTGITFSNCQMGVLSDFSITAQGLPQSLANCSGLQVDTGSGNFVIERINFNGFSLDGLRQVGTLGNQMSGHVVRDCYFLGNGRNQLYMIYSNDFEVNNNQYGMLSGIPHAQSGAYLDTCSHGTYSENKHWNNGIAMQAINSTGNRYVSNRWEESDKQGIYISGGDHCLFVDNIIHTNSLLGNGLYDYAYFTNATFVTFVSNEVFSWNATYGRIGVNFDVGCDELNLGKNIVRGYDATNFGPWRFDGSISRVDGDEVFPFNGAAVAAGTSYLGGPGSSANEGAVLRASNRRFAIARLYAATDVAPGAGLSYIYTLRKNGTNTAMSATSTGAASFSAATNNTAPEIVFDAGDSTSVQVVVSPGAAAANHRGYIVCIEY